MGLSLVIYLALNLWSVVPYNVYKQQSCSAVVLYNV